jgi:hypothetical protein
MLLCLGRLALNWTALRSLSLVMILSMQGAVLAHDTPARDPTMLNIETEELPPGMLRMTSTERSHPPGARTPFHTSGPKVIHLRAGQPCGRGAEKQQFSGDRSSVGRVPDCDSGRRGFESHRSPQLTLSAPSAVQSSLRLKQLNSVYETRPTSFRDC